MTTPAWLRPILAVIVGPLIGAMLTYLTTKYGIPFTDEQRQKIVQDVTASILAVLTLFYTYTGLAKVFINRKVNPMNAASSELAEEGKDAQRDAKHTRSMRTQSKRREL
jgi:hypothetical protein